MNLQILISFVACISITLGSVPMVELSDRTLEKSKDLEVGYSSGDSDIIHDQAQGRSNENNEESTQIQLKIDDPNEVIGQTHPKGNERDPPPVPLESLKRPNVDNVPTCLSIIALAALSSALTIAFIALLDRKLWF